VVLKKEKRNELILSLIPQVRKIALNIYKHIPEGAVELDDLIQEGILGVLKAFKRLKKGSITPNGKLSPEAVSFLLVRAKGAIFDYLRSLDFGSKKLRARERELENIRKLLKEKLKREPTEEEIASAMGIGIDELYQLEEKISFSYLLSLEDIFNENFKGGFENFISSSSNVEKEVEKKELLKKLVEALQELDEKEILVLQLLFFEGLKTQEVAKVLDISVGRVSQIKRNALKKLSREMEKYL